MKSMREWTISLSRLTLVVAGGSGIALFLLATLDVFKPLKSTRAVLNVESVCALAIVILTFVSVNGKVSPKATHRSVPGLFAILLGMLVAACYWPSLSIGFLSDDFISVKYANTLTGDQVLGTFLHPSGGSFFRPLEYVSLRATAPWAGFDPIRWHAANMLVHFANSVLVYSVAARLYQGFWTPAMASLLFAVHGTRPEAVAWVNGRLDLITAFFFLLALLLYLRYCETPRVSLLAASLVSMLCAVMTKESAYVFPLILLLIAWFKKERGFRRPAVHLPFWLLTVAVFAYRWILLGGIGGYRGKVESLQMGVIGWVKAMVLRVWAILYFPINWSTQPELWLALLLGLYVVSLILLAKSSYDGRSRRFALAFTFVASLPAVALLLIGPDLQKARLLYLPSFGYCVWAAVSMEAIRKPWVRWSIAATLLCFHIAALEHNLSIWRHVSSLANRTCDSAAAQSANAKRVAAGLPESINGVYFFANGFAECVEIHSRAK